MMKQFYFSLAVAALGLVTACNNAETAAKTDNAATTTDTSKSMVSSLREETVSYSGDGITMKGFVAYDANSSAKRPAIIIVHEWWGLNDYVKRRARELAQLGYVAFAADFYGNGMQASTPDSAGKMAMPFYTNPTMAKARFDAALAQLKSMSVTDSTKIAAIGYCFGGAQVLNMARLGEDLKAVVSFHGNLIGVPAKKEALKAKVLVCHGEADQFVKPAEVAAFKKQMDSIKADYTFKSYPGATHAFTNPDATATGEKFKMPIAYNAAADTSSWNEMKAFFGTIFK